MPNSYKWLKDSPYLFQKAFDTEEVKQIVRKFMDSPFVVDNDVLSRQFQQHYLYSMLKIPKTSQRCL